MFHVGFSGFLSQHKLQELVSEIDPKQVLDEDVEEVIFSAKVYPSWYDLWRGNNKKSYYLKLSFSGMHTENFSSGERGRGE